MVSRCPWVSTRRCRGWFAPPGLGGPAWVLCLEIRANFRHLTQVFHFFVPRRSPGQILHSLKHSRRKQTPKFKGCQFLKIRLRHLMKFSELVAGIPRSDFVHILNSKALKMNERRRDRLLKVWAGSQMNRPVTDAKVVEVGNPAEETCYHRTIMFIP
jgi:hypothetical protein